MKAQHPEKILFIIGLLKTGGAEKQLSLLAEELVKRNINVAIFVLTKNGDLEQRLHDLGITIIGGGYNRTDPIQKKFFQLLNNQLRLLLYCYQWKPSVIHSFLPLTNFMATLACKIQKIPCLTSWRSLTHYREKWPLFRLMDRFSLSFSSSIVCNSQAVLEDIRKKDPWLPSAKINVIYNGVIFPLKNNSSNSSPLKTSLWLSPRDIGIIYVANLIPYKGHEDLLRAFALLPIPRNKNLKLFLVGEDRGIQSSLTNIAKKLDIIERVTFLGDRTDVSQILRCMNIGVMASHEEGFSNALLEKLEAELPVVATDVGGNKEALKGMKECYLVPSKNPQALAKGLEKAIKNLIATKNKYGKERSTSIKSKYSVEEMVEKYLVIYKNL